MGTVYLIHFEKPYKHARHYLGFSEDADARLVQHQNGNGARLLQVVKQAGINYNIVRLWENKDRHFERRLKNWKKSKQLCPVCKREKNENCS
jgi:predicted GIY-YIG superfamily endonuclease